MFSPALGSPLFPPHGPPGLPGSQPMRRRVSFPNTPTLAVVVSTYLYPVAWAMRSAHCPLRPGHCPLRQRIVRMPITPPQCGLSPNETRPSCVAAVDCCYCACCISPSSLLSFDSASYSYSSLCIFDLIRVGKPRCCSVIECEQCIPCC